MLNFLIVTGLYYFTSPHATLQGAATWRTW